MENSPSSIHLHNTIGEVREYFLFLNQGCRFTLLKKLIDIQFQYCPEAIQATKHEFCVLKLFIFHQFLLSHRLLHRWLISISSLYLSACLIPRGLSSTTTFTMQLHQLAH